VLGFDARMQFLHEQDLMDVLVHAIRTDLPGTFNIAGDGILMLSQALRRLRRPTVPMPGFAVGSVGSVLRSARLADFSPEQLSFLTYGRGVDTTRMRDMLGFEPSFTTEEAFGDFAAGLTPTGGRVEALLTAALDQLPPADQPPALSSVGGGDRG
jgi:UDP-glucose 4-epimerase